MPFLRSPKLDINLDVSTEPLYPGGTLNAGILVSSHESCTLRSGSVELSCTEVYWKVVSDGKSTRQQEFRRRLFRIEDEFLVGAQLSPGMALSEQTSVALPADAPPTTSGKTVNGPVEACVVRTPIDIALQNCCRHAGQSRYPFTALGIHPRIPRSRH